MYTQHIAPKADQIAPGCNIGVGKSQKGQSAFQQNGNGHDNAGIDNHGRQRIRQDFTEDDAPIPHAKPATSLHEFPIAEAEEFSARQPRRSGPGNHANRDHNGGKF